ncbi:MAG TPA: isoprenylcysteine carboxylmethyltransferase family protein [Fibrobacteria bacterium]|nr:isoprenylcysteine carboxylmethyltransferase family protein [Fibrobacteria bacterium]HOX52728.1 isoprenylcysteine carboxylmethyltransferase family protein [Fibrobacteria bacterium]
MSLTIFDTTFRFSSWFWIFVAVFSMRNLAETLLVKKRASGEDGHRTGATSLALFVTAYFVAGFGTGFFLTLHTPHPVLFWTGMVGFVALHRVRTWILRDHLKEGWNPFTTPRTDSQLATSGPYRFLRHPLYALHLVELGCLWLILPNAIAAIAWLVDLAATLARIPGEERLLAQRYGSMWDQYARRTRRMVPWIW